MNGWRGRASSSMQDTERRPQDHSQLSSSELLRCYYCCEASRIKEAYNACNFTSLRDLPDKIQAGEVAQQQRRKVAEALRPRLKAGKCEQESKLKCWSKNGGLFRRFEYIPERYSLAEEAKAKEKASNEEMEFSIGQGRKFSVPGSRKTLKHEDCFMGERASFKYDPDPYDSLRDEQLRARWIEQSRILFGPFIPVGRARNLTEPSRAWLPQITRALLERLKATWAKHIPQVHVTEKGTVAVRLEAVSLECHVGVIAFMNNLEANDPDFLRYKLRKIPGQWGLEPGDGYL